MHFEKHNKKNTFPQSLRCGQVKQKPIFSYLSPIKIHDEEFPEDIQEITKEYSEEEGVLAHIRNDEETIYDISHIRRVAGLKFSKSSFVKMKNKNYTKNYKTVLSCIGKGAFGTVRKVQSLISKEFRAAKCIKKNSMKDDELEKLLAEVYIMMEIDHPNIANILEVYDFKNEFTLICELCEGGDLMKFLRSTQRKKNHEKLVANIVKQLLRTIIYLHNNGIVHRDIKPHNILFEKYESHNIKLIDFGIATKIEPNEILTSRVGTPAYMAPEILYERYNEKADVWAVGATMYHLISGRIPFKGDTVKEIMHSIMKNEIEFYGEGWKNISPECIEVIRLMTKKNPLERPSAKEIFEHPYFQKYNDFDLSEQEKHDFTDSIRRFEFKNKLQAAIQTFIASQLLSVEEKNELVDFFREFDKDNDGVISTEELKFALEKRKKISHERIDSLMDIIDTNGSGKIDYTEFLAAGFLDAKSFTIERLKQAFAHFDTNGNGKISIEEVMDFMEILDDEEEELQKIFGEFDSNNDGSITEDEFIAIMLERSKNMNLEKLKDSNSHSQLAEKRFDEQILDKACFEFEGNNNNNNNNNNKAKTEILLRNLTNQANHQQHNHQQHKRDSNKKYTIM